MRSRYYGILLAGCLAGCTAATPPVEETAVPDHFNPNLDLVVHGTGHPCGSDFELGDGQSRVHTRYTYDSLGRLQTRIRLDATGAPDERIGYEWDNAGHLTHVHDATPSAGSLVESVSLYDTLGRLTQARSTTSDLDPADDHHVGSMRSTVTYRDFDELGHPAHADHLDEDLDAHTSQTQTESYRYDDLGRQTRVEVRTASGELTTTEQVMYDDAARTVSWEVQLPASPDPTIANDLRATDQYDGDGRWLSRHQQNLRPDGMVVMLQDVAVTWDGDRELSEVTSISPPDHPWTFRLSTTFQYACE